MDANAIIINGNGNNDCCCCLFFLFCGFVLGIFCCLCVKICVFCFRGAWWMPWYAKPMKDVIGCVKPRGVA